MNKYTNLSYYAFATINTFFTLIGTVLLVINCFCINLANLGNENAPYVVQFFFLYSGINILFLFFLGRSAFFLFKKNPTGINLLSKILKLELLYMIVMSTVWMLFPKAILRSSAAATGIGNMGISAQFFILYPITGLLVLWLLKKSQIIQSSLT